MGGPGGSSSPARFAMFDCVALVMRAIELFLLWSLLVGLVCRIVVVLVLVQLSVVCDSCSG